MAGGLSLRETWANLGIVAKLLWVAVMVCLPALVAVWLWMNTAQREYRVLFAGLPDKDGGEVVKALEKLRIPYQLSEPGGAIEVPLSQLHIARYKLAVEGIPTAEHATVEQPGMRFGLSSFQEQAAHQRSLETELAHSIKTIAGIESARVHLALPRQSSFLREPVQPSASVLLKLAPGAAPTPGQVEAVRLIVANSVPGMAVEQVSVLDQHGALPALAHDTEAPQPHIDPAADRRPVNPVQLPPTVIERAAQQTELPARSAQAMQAWLGRVQSRDVMLGLLLAALTAWLMLRLRARRLRAMTAQEAEADVQEAQSLDMQLARLRQRVMADPRVAASVIKLWVRET